MKPPDGVKKYPGAEEFLRVLEVEVFDDGGSEILFVKSVEIIHRVEYPGLDVFRYVRTPQEIGYAFDEDVRTDHLSILSDEFFEFIDCDRVGRCEFHHRPPCLVGDIVRFVVAPRLADDTVGKTGEKRGKRYILFLRWKRFESGKGLAENEIDGFLGKVIPMRMFLKLRPEEYDQLFV